MKLFRILPLVVGSAVAGILASTSPAHALDFTFTFTGDQGAHGVTSGTIYGLQDNATSAATDVVVTTSVTSTLFPSVIGSYLGSDLTVGTNSFTVAGGVITAADFDSRGGSPFRALLLNTSLLSNRNQIGNCTISCSYNFNGFAGATYTSASATVPFDIPGGATIPTVGSLLALVAMRKARKSLASNTRIANPIATPVSVG